MRPEKKADEEAFDRERISGHGVNHLKQASLNMQSASLAIQKSGHRLGSKESAIFAHNLKLTSMTSRLKIEAQRAAACNDWSRYDSLAEKVELQEHELGLLAMSLRDDKDEKDIDNSTISSISPALNKKKEENDN